MNTRNLEGTVFVVCASCTLLAVGAAFAAVLHQLFTLAVSVIELMMSPQALAAITR
jgi:hypothetical protein